MYLLMKFLPPFCTLQGELRTRLGMGSKKGPEVKGWGIRRLLRECGGKGDVMLWVARAVVEEM